MKLKGVLLLLTLVGIGLLMQACSRPQKPEPSCNFVQNPEQQRVSWQRRLPVKLYLHSSIPAEAYDAIDRAVSEYNLKLGGGHEVFRIMWRLS